MKKNQIGNVCLFIVLIGIRGRHKHDKNGWKETEYVSHVEEIDEKR